MKKLRKIQIHAKNLKGIFDRFQQNVDNEKEIWFQDSRHVGKEIARTMTRLYYLGSKWFTVEKTVKKPWSQYWHNFSGSYSWVRIFGR
jgi:hypothetical protein